MPSRHFVLTRPFCLAVPNHICEPKAEQRCYGKEFASCGCTKNDLMHCTSTLLSNLPLYCAIANNDTEAVEKLLTTQDAGSDSRVTTSSVEDAPIFSVGLICEYADMLDAHIGCHRWTVGLHSDGKVYENYTTGTYTDATRRMRYGPRNTVGGGDQLSKRIIVLHARRKHPWYVDAGIISSPWRANKTRATGGAVPLSLMWRTSTLRSLEDRE